MTTQAGLRAAKTALRKKMKDKLKGLTAEDKLRQSMRVTEKLLSLGQYSQARSVALYLSMEDEVNTASILEDVFSSGKVCYVPRYEEGGSRMEMVRLRDLEDYQGLPTTRWNIKQPERGEEREEALQSEAGLDLILVPGLAFTRTGGRCGRGRGYYDTYLARALSSLPSQPTTIGLAFAEQLVEEEELPTDEHDHNIDFVISSD